MNNFLLPFLFVFLTSQGYCPDNNSHPIPQPDHKPSIRGLSFVAPPRPFPENPMPAVQKVHANWIAVIPYGYTRRGETSVRFNMTNRQWWGECEEGINQTISLGKQAGLQILLKPQVWGHNLWTGELDFESEEEWSQWQAAYREYIMFYAAIAQEQEVEMLCIGTEYKIAAIKREQFWRDLIDEVRTTYQGKITYASNWDHYQEIPFWDMLDMVGVNAYFPLVEEKSPSIKKLKKSWERWVKELDQFYEEVRLPVAFTEYGYLSVDGCAHNTWELEAIVNNTPINEQAQANAFAALFESLSTRTYWQGGFLWKWFPNMQGHEGYPERDYTPQGKIGEQVVTEYYGQWGLQ